MPKFSDCLGREWDVRIVLGVLPKLREAGFDINAVARDPKQLESLADPETLGKVLWTLCKSQATAKGITEEGFQDGFDGETIQNAVEAMLGAIVSFSQPREVAAKVMGLIPGAIETQTAIQMARIDSMLKPTGGSVPASPGSTVQNERSAS